MTPPKNISAGPEYGLVVQQDGILQQELTRFLTLVLNYQYGLELVVAPDLFKGSLLRMQYGKSIRCAFVIQDQGVDNKIPINDLSRHSQIPLFLLLPADLAGQQAEFCEGRENVFVHPWEKALMPTDCSLAELIETAFVKNGIAKLLDDTKHVPYDVLQQKVECRLRHLHTLPALPEIVLRIMRL